MVLAASVAAMLLLAAGMADGTRAQFPFDTYYTSPFTPPSFPEPDEVGPRIATTGSPSSVRASRSGTFTYTVGPFSEEVRGAVSFQTVKAVGARKAKKRKLTLGRKTFRAAAGTRGRVRIKLSKTQRLILRRYRALRIRARVRATDANLNDSSKSLSFTLKRPR